MAVRREHRPDLLENGDPLLLHEIGARLAIRVGVAQRGDRAVDLDQQRRGIEIADLRALGRALEARQSRGARQVDVKAAIRRRRDVELEVPAPIAEPAARPVEFGGRQVSGVKPVDQERVHVRMLDRFVNRERILAGQRRRAALEAQVAGPQEQRVQLLPFGGDRAVAAKQAQQVIGAVEVDETGRNPRQAGVPPPVVVARGRRLEPRVIGKDEAVADVECRLPEAVGELRRPAQVFEVPLEQATTVDGERAIEKHDCRNPVEVERGARVP